MGSGKSTVGRLLAIRLGWPLLDSDRAIEADEGRTVRELRDQVGTEAMHAIEARQLLRALATPGPTVICAAASTVDDEVCLEALRDPELLVAWLSVSSVTAAARFDAQGHRPTFGDDPAALLARQAAERAPRFRATGAVELTTDGRTPDELAAVVLEAVEAHRRHRTGAIRPPGSRAPESLRGRHSKR